CRMLTWATYLRGSVLFPFYSPLPSSPGTARTRIAPRWIAWVWFTETYERRFPGMGQDQGRIEEATIEVHVRNARDRPGDVVQLAYEVRTRWMVPVGPQDPVSAHEFTAGDGCVQAFLNDFRVPPGETLDTPFPVNVAHLAPEGAVQLAPIQGVTATA